MGCFSAYAKDRVWVLEAWQSQRGRRVLPVLSNKCAVCTYEHTNFLNTTKTLVQAELHTSSTDWIQFRSAAQI